MYSMRTMLVRSLPCLILLFVLQPRGAWAQPLVEDGARSYQHWAGEGTLVGDMYGRAFREWTVTDSVSGRSGRVSPLSPLGPSVAPAVEF